MEQKPSPSCFHCGGAPTMRAIVRDNAASLRITDFGFEGE